jgi:hypothetical protein
LTFWNETGKGREQLLTEVFALLEAEGWRYSADTGCKDWDVQIYGHQFWTVQLRSVTEYHGGPKCLTRVHLKSRPVVTTVMLHYAVGLVFAYRFLFLDRVDRIAWAVWGVTLFWFFLRSLKLRRRIADLVVAAGQRCELGLVVKKGNPAARPVTESSSSESAEGEAGSGGESEEKKG